MPEVHAEYSPSSLGDKMKCPGRHLATVGLDNGTSEDADRGTECHDWAEKLLPAVLYGQTCPPPDFVENWQEDCTKEMVQHAMDIHDAMEKNGKVAVYTEAQVNLGDYRDDLPDFDLHQVWGTSDVIMYCRESGELTILDYKTGQGVAVSPVNNTQLSVYALGAVGFIEQQVQGAVFNKINVCISQPRIEQSLQVWETDLFNLDMWLRAELIPALVKMSSPDAEFVPGESQCRWCPIKGRCKAQRDEMLQLFDTPAADETGEAPTFSDDQIDSLMLRLPEFKQWLKQIESVGLEVLENGGELENFKLVRGTSHRKWIDASKVDTYLKGQGLKDKDRYTRKLLSPAQAEKALKIKDAKPRVQTNFNKLWEKPEGKISYALKSDPRPGITVNKTAMLVNLEDLL